MSSRRKRASVLLRPLLFPSILLLVILSATLSALAGATGGSRFFYLTGVESELGEMDPRLEAVLTAFGSNRYDECRRLAEALIEESDDSSTRAECVGLVILSYLHQGEFNAAREAAERLRSVSPHVCSDLLDQVNRDERDYQAEVNHLQQIVATSDNPEESARAQLRIARVYHMFGCLELVEVICREMIQRIPSCMEAGGAVSHLALLTIEKREYASGLCQMERIVRRHPKTLAALRAQSAIARINLAQGKPECAVEAYSEIVRRYPRTEAEVDARFAIASISIAHGKLERAIAAYSAIIHTYPGTEAALDAQFSIAETQLAGIQPERAIETYMAIIENHPRVDAAAKAQLTIAEIHNQQGRIGQSEAAYLTAARNYRGTAASRRAHEALARMYYARARSASATEDLAVALEAYRKAVHVDLDRDRKSKFSLHIADLCQALGRWEEARAAAKEVLRLDPVGERNYILRRRRARDVIADSYYRQGLYAEALALYEQLLAECIAQSQESILGKTDKPAEPEGYRIMIAEIRRVQDQALPGETPAQQTLRLQEAEG